MKDKSSTYKKVWASVKQFFQSDRGKITVLSLVLMLAVVLFAISIAAFRYHIGVDAISYLSISRQYADGHITSAVNAFWSPLVSWLLIPLVNNMPGMLAYMGLNAVAALGVLVGGAAFVWRATGKSFIAALAYLLILTPFLVEAVRVKSPDLLVMAWMLLFVVVMVWAFRMVAKGKIWQVAVIFGVVGVLGYVTKLYLLPVFVVGFIVWLLLAFYVQKPAGQRSLTFLRQHKRTWITLPLVGFGTMIVVASPWVAALSLKYDEFTVGSSFTINVASQFSKKVSGTYDSSEGSAKVEELKVPPNEQATHHFADPTYHMPEKSPDDAEHAPGLRHKVQVYLGDKLKGFPFYINRLSSINPFSVPILMIAGLALLMGAIRLKRHTAVVATWMLGVIYFGGYALMSNPNTGGGNTRYYWPVFLLMTLVFCLLLPLMWRQVSKFRQWPRKALFVVVALVVVLMPTVLYIGGLRYMSMIPVQRDLTIVQGQRSQMIETLSKGFQEPEKPYAIELAEAIQQDDILPKGAKVVGDDYITSLYVAHLLELRYFGSRQAGYDALKNPAQKLDEYGITHLLSFTPAGEKPHLIVDGSVEATYTYILPCNNNARVNSQYIECDVRVIRLR